VKVASQAIPSWSHPKLPPFPDPFAWYLRVNQKNLVVLNVYWGKRKKHSDHSAFEDVCKTFEITVKIFG